MHRSYGFQHLRHKRPRLLSPVKVGNTTRLSEKNRTQGHTRRNRGCLRWGCTGADSAIENGRSFFVGCCGVKYVSLPACTDTALSASEQTTFQYLRGAEYHYSWTASRTVETLLKDVRAFYLHGRRMREREKQRSFWTSTHALCVDVQRRRGPAGTRSPAAGSCAVLVNFTVCHRCVEIQERAFTRLAVPTALSALCDVQWFCPMQQVVVHSMLP